MSLLDVLSLDTPALGLVALAAFVVALWLINGCIWAWDWWREQRNGRADDPSARPVGWRTRSILLYRDPSKSDG